MTNPINSKAFELLLLILQEERSGLRGQEVVAEVLDQEGIEYTTDRHGNMTVQVGERKDIMFTSHTDTVDFEDDGRMPPWMREQFPDAVPPKAKPAKKKLAVLNGHLALDADGIWDCLGADDGAGVVLMIMMIKHGIEGTYWFFAEEEVGRVGSTGALEDAPDSFKDIKWCISFDRRGMDIIHTQIGGRCASDEFAKALCDRFERPHSKMNTGIYTDSATFMDVIPECTNIGVGYYREHSDMETLNLNEFYDTLSYCVKPETWAELPVGERPKRQDVLDDDFDLDIFDWLDKQDNGVDIDAVLDELGQFDIHEVLEWTQKNPLKTAAIMYLCGNIEARSCVGKDVHRAMENEGLSIKQIVQRLKADLG